VAAYWRGRSPALPSKNIFLRAIVSFLSEDVIPPTVHITSPVHLSILTSSPITVSGTVDDETATVTVNGVTATVSGGIFTAPAVPLQEGLNTLTATATDPAGNIGTASIQVTLDTVPPNLSITAPVAGSLLFQNRPSIQVSYSDLNGVNTSSLTFSANGQPLPVDCQLESTGGSCTPTPPPYKGRFF
jgi:hypothetical protein